ncbi:unnamed protein product [Macrosiphum euphorbiae]|uniref:Uncharacterized protein n=1 Tax=Macrosiphum euphorbiae TaxID=13131 RepID=A0AAV0WVB9_9HEMI|nr:unnamed protein product [Macrosiphum euphorbiae]
MLPEKSGYWTIPEFPTAFRGVLDRIGQSPEFYTSSCFAHEHWITSESHNIRLDKAINSTLDFTQWGRAHPHTSKFPGISKCVWIDTSYMVIYKFSLN